MNEPVRFRWPAAHGYIGHGRIAFGGDYNPEQWTPDVWREDMRLMKEAGVNFVSVGIFAWGALQPAPDTWNFEWLDQVMDLLNDNAIAVDLANATASPPLWFSAKYPEARPVDMHGHRYRHLGRQVFCPSSPVYREHALNLTRRVAERYREHPALALWHVSNEMGCHNARCYCEISAAHFRRWLQDRYGSLDKLNDAWGTAFWSLQVSDWDEISVPGPTTSFVPPTLELDFARFSSDAIREELRYEAEAIRAITPNIPITTNLIAGTNSVDVSSLVDCVDLVSNDNYRTRTGRRADADVALSGDITRGAAAGRPWLLMEHSTSAVNWLPVNQPKLPGQLRLDALTHIARGADGVGFFQWRQSISGAEKFHSAMLPHAGVSSQVWRNTVSLGASLARLGEVTGSRVVTDTAIVADYASWWALERQSLPSTELDYMENLSHWHQALTDIQLAPDVISPSAEFNEYRLVVVPSLYLMDEATVRRMSDFVHAGGHLVVTYFTGIADPDDHVYTGGYPGALRELLGVRVEEFHPLRPGEDVRLCGDLFASGTGTVWAEPVQLVDARALARYTSIESPGHVTNGLYGYPAITVAERDAGTAWYVSTQLDEASLQTLVETAAVAAGLTPLAFGERGLDVVMRRGASADYLFAINRTDAARRISGDGTDLLTGHTHFGSAPVPARDAVVLRRPRDGGLLDA